MVITEPAVTSARLLGLGLKQYPRNEQRMLNNDLTQFVLSLSRVRQSTSKSANERKGSEGKMQLCFKGRWFVSNSLLFIIMRKNLLKQTNIERRKKQTTT